MLQNGKLRRGLLLNAERARRVHGLQKATPGEVRPGGRLLFLDRRSQCEGVQPTVVRQAPGTAFYGTLAKTAQLEHIDLARDNSK